MLFEYEKALADKGIKPNALPDAIKEKIRTFNGLCRQLNDTDEEDLEAQTELNTKIDALDTEIKGEIESYTPAPADPKPTDPKPADPKSADPEPKQESESNVGGWILGGILVTGAVLVIKRLMGK